MALPKQKKADTNSNSFVTQKLLSIERKLADLETSFTDLEESLAIFKHGMAEIKKKHIEEYRHQGRLHEIDFQHKLLRQINEDTNLADPLRNLMEFMIKELDLVKHQFKELNFSQIRKESPVSGGKLSGYLNELVERGLLIKREDGYHAYYKTNYKAYDQNRQQTEAPKAAEQAA